MTALKTTYTDTLDAGRDMAGATTDAQIEDVLRREWMNFDRDASCADKEAMERIRSNIRRGIGPVSAPGRKHPLWRRVAVAAAVLLPLLVVSAVLLQVRNARTASDMMTISTGDGEKATVTLPDGTKITLNVNSKLEYSARSYNRRERRVSFDGEGYFDVARNEDVPCVIDSRGMEVAVLGTAFNLSNREGMARAELSLERGSVRLLSTRNGKTAVLKPDQRATLHHLTGEIEVTCEDRIADDSAWRRGDLVFRNTKLANVLKTIEANYGLRVDMSNCPADMNEMFTGTLPAGNLDEVIHILEYSFHMKSSVYDNTLYFSAR